MDCFASARGRTNRGGRIMKEEDARTLAEDEGAIDIEPLAIDEL